VQLKPHFNLLLGRGGGGDDVVNAIFGGISFLHFL
jgi:hypothetical protein